MEHEHEHTHTCTHTHPHDHEHEHPHDHEHESITGEVGGSARTRALLQYMIEHNDHHAEELAELLDHLEGAPRKKLLEAIGSFEVANTQLREVLALME